jgi:folate-binding protein YgfZ
MSLASPFIEAHGYRPAHTVEQSGVPVAALFDTPAREYEHARTSAAVVDRSHRGLLVVTGNDRMSWLHSLVTNSVTALAPERGCYAFATDVKGRILFDLNILNRGESLWLDLDCSAIPTAATHFDRHLFTEDVRIADVSGQYARLGCTGPEVDRLASRIGLTGLASVPQIATRHLDQDETLLLRHDFAGWPGFELILPRGQARAWWDRLVDLEAHPIGHATLDLLRIEAGIPWLGRELNDAVLPAETGQTERAVSHNKGCYLGHEIIERMRSRGARARRLTRIEVPDGAGVALPAPLRQGATSVGHATSLVPHPQHGNWIGLGYLNTAASMAVPTTVGDPARPVTLQP